MIFLNAKIAKWFLFENSHPVKKLEKFLVNKVFKELHL